jgi:hypothetical protein
MTGFPEETLMHLQNNPNGGLGPAGEQSLQITPD